MDYIAEIQRCIETVNKIVLDFRDAVERINKNDGLSAIGRKRDLAALGENALGRLYPYFDKVADARKWLAGYRRSLEIQVKPGNEVVAEMRAREIRDTCPSSMGRVDVLEWFPMVIESGNAEAFFAIINAPLPLLTEEQAARFKKDWSEKFLPEKVQQGQDLAEKIDLFEYAVTSAERDIRDEAGISKPDKLLVTAETGVIAE
jgi:hypothetical protein